MSPDMNLIARIGHHAVLPAFVAIAAISVPAPAAAETILVGRAQACTVHTIQAALDRAHANGGDNRILVTNDADGATYRESLALAGQDEGAQLEIAGGLSDCVTLEPTPVRTTVQGGVPGQSVLFVSGRTAVRLSGLRMEGGSKGLEWQGFGDIELVDASFSANNGAGIAAIGNGGDARLSFAGGVDVSANLGDGIFLWDTMLAIHGDGNAVAQNSGSGILADGASSVQIGARGKVISGNNGYGISVSHFGASEAPPTLLYSIDAADPLRISGNTQGAIFQTARGSSHRLCTRGIAIDGNQGLVIRSDGALSTLDINGDLCVFPPEADVVCAAPREIGQCNAITANSASTQPLIAAIDGARIDMQRVLIAGNSAGSLLTALRADNETASRLTLKNALVSGNIADTRLVESINGSAIDIADATIRDNFGDFVVSFLAGGSYSLVVTDSIVDQPQALISFSGDPSALRMTRVLARNRDGMPDGGDHEILLGTPVYADTDGRLMPGSPGVDYAPAGGGVDFDGRARDIDIPETPNVHGTRDLGAFEAQELPLFADGFEAT